MNKKEFITDIISKINILAQQYQKNNTTYTENPMEWGNHLTLEIDCSKQTISFNLYDETCRSYKRWTITNKQKNETIKDEIYKNILKCKNWDITDKGSIFYDLYKYKPIR